MFDVFDREGMKNRITTEYKPDIARHSEVLKSKELLSNNERNREFERKMDTNYSSGGGHTFSQATHAYKQMTNMDTAEEIFHVSQLMTWPVITINDNQSIYECWELMKEHDIKQIPVVGSHGKLKGMATVKKLSNVLMENLNNEQYIKAAFVDVIMKDNIITAQPISDIRRVSKMMVMNHLNCLPVVNENDKIVGIISRADILRTIEENPHIRLWG